MRWSTSSACLRRSAGIRRRRGSKRRWPSVRVREDDGVPYLRIVVEPYPVAISYRGIYYQRSGSTNQILRGPALDRFLLGKTGRCWDGMPDPRVALEDLDPAAIAGFRKRASKEKRLSGDALAEDDAGLIEKLRLTDGDYLTKAAILLFHRDLELFVAGRAGLAAVEGRGEMGRYAVEETSEQEGPPMVRSPRSDWSDE